MKRLLISFFVVTLVLGLAAVPVLADGGITVSMSGVTAGEVKSGAELDLTLSVDNPTGEMIQTIGLTMKLPEGWSIVSYTKVQAGEMFNDLNTSTGILAYLNYPGKADSSFVLGTVKVKVGEVFGADKEISLALDGKNCKVASGSSVVFSPSAPLSMTVIHEHAETDWEQQRNETQHWMQCKVCGEKKDFADHDKAGMQSDASGHSFTCSVCGYEATTEDHVYGAWTDGGNGKHYQECTVCKYKNEEDHQVDETWKYNDENHYKECSVCHAQTEVTKHTLTEVQGNSAATCTMPGTYQEECLTCGYKTKAIESPALGHKWGEWTADPNNPPSCVKAGVETRTCERENCDGGEGDLPAVESRNTDKLPHEFETYEVTTPATYLKDGVETAKCKWYGETGEDGTTCEATDTRAIPKLELTDDVLKITVDAKPEFVNNKAVMDELQDTIESAVKDIADGGEPATVKTAFIEAVKESLRKNEGDVSVAVTVSLEEVTDPTALPEKLQKDAKGMNFEAGWKLGITALVDGKTTVEDAMDALPVPAEYALSKPEYAAPIGVQFEDVSAGCFGYPAVKKDGAFLVEAQPAGYYALFTTGDLSSGYVDYNFTDIYTYTGSAIEPKVVVTINGGEPVDPKYYSVEYKDNTNVGDAQIIITLTDEGKAAGFILEEPLTFTFTIAAAPATATPKPTGTGSTNNNGNAPETGDETNVALYAVILAVCTAALVLVTLRKKSSR